MCAVDTCFPAPAAAAALLTSGPCVAGDVLFFPSFWWHGVQNLDDETVAVDLPLIDILGSWRRNAIFTLTSLLNPNVIGDSIGALLTGGSLRGVFFAGYRKEGLKEGE